MFEQIFSPRLAKAFSSIKGWGALPVGKLPFSAFSQASLRLLFALYEPYPFLQQLLYKV